MTDRSAGEGTAGQCGAVVSVYEDGPLIVRGDITIAAQGVKGLPRDDVAVVQTRAWPD